MPIGNASRNLMGGPGIPLSGGGGGAGALVVSVTCASNIAQWQFDRPVDIDEMLFTGGLKIRDTSSPAGAQLAEDVIAVEYPFAIAPGDRWSIDEAVAGLTPAPAVGQSGVVTEA